MVGLGNPGPRYENTRHNLGFMVVDRLAHEAGAGFKAGPGGSLVAEITVAGGPLLLAKPQTFMNASGRAVSVLVGRYLDSDADGLLVIHDDLALEWGRIRLVRGGGPGGHRGVTSVIGALGHDAFPRLKIGIGRPERGEDPERYVLDGFYPGQRSGLARQIGLGAEAAVIWAIEGLEKAMNLVNSPTWAEN